MLHHLTLQEQHSEEQFEVACNTPLQTMALGPVAIMLSPAAKRKAASEFIQATTGVFVPFSSDQSFRGVLKDGVLLCRMANALWDGIIAQVGYCWLAATAAALTIMAVVIAAAEVLHTAASSRSLSTHLTNRCRVLA